MVSNMATLTIAFLAALCVVHDKSHVESANILVLMPLQLKSHKIILDQIVIELLSRGHNITYVSSYTAEQNLPGLNNIYLEDAAKKPQISEYPQYRKRTKCVYKVFRTLGNLVGQWCNTTMTDRVMLDFLRQRPKFDVVLISAYYNEYLLAVAHHIQAPAVLMYSGNTFPYAQWMLDVPISMSTYAQTFFAPYPLVPPMNFVDRLVNAIGFGVNYYVTANMFMAPVDKMVQEILPNSPDISTLMGQAAFTLINAHPLVTGIQPSMPHVAQIGGIHLRPPQPLNTEWARIVNETGEEGFILFSLGSVSRGIKMSEDLRIRLVQVFRRLPYTVFVKYEEEMRNIPSNIKLYKWFPLQDLMAHPKCRLLINHGGLLSMQEAMYHGIPVLAIPSFAEHKINAARAFQQGFSRNLNWQTFKVEDALKVISEMLSTNSYRENAEKISKIVKDHPIHPRELAAYWVEYVIRHKDTHHLKRPQDLNILQYFSVDVICVIALAIVIPLALVLYIAYKCLFYIGIYLSFYRVNIPKKQKRL